MRGSAVFFLAFTSTNRDIVLTALGKPQQSPNAFSNVFRFPISDFFEGRGGVNCASKHSHMLPSFWSGRENKENIQMLQRPLVIGHRGSSYNLPEHTLASYRLALELGADYIEPDLVPTSDGVLVACHSIDLNITTNVAEVFPDRYRLDVSHSGEKYSGYFVQDFALQEVKQLRVRQRIEETNARTNIYDWKFDIPTLDEIINLLEEWNLDDGDGDIIGLVGRNGKVKPGLYPELKIPGWIFEDSAIIVEDLLINALRLHPAAGRLFFNPNHFPHDNFVDVPRMSYGPQSYVATRPFPPLVLQCFEGKSLKYMREKIVADVEHFRGVVPPSVLLFEKKDCTAELWNDVDIANADGIGPDKHCLLNETGKQIMKEAKARGVAVHPWTERLETKFVLDTLTDAMMETKYLFCNVGVDGLFFENVDVGVQASQAGCSCSKMQDWGWIIGLCMSFIAIGLFSSVYSMRRQKFQVAETSVENETAAIFNNAVYS
mmetsp:Transcript_12152/g.26601  ORF Transcript_12152/g.26601 Transcript_12152/m.26601 type:complete len:489 (-) Transcript_12152:605-2071(-)